MLKIDHLSLKRGDFHLRANFALGPGICAVIGPSGGGKSTLLSLLVGFDTPASGTMAWSGKAFGDAPPGKRPVAMLFQDNNLFPHLDVLTNVTLGVAPRATPSVIERAKAVLVDVGLSGMENRKPADLSGGQQSRAALARTLLTDRPIVLMDEAFSALGPALKAEMLDLVARLMPDKCILMVTHDPDDATRFAQQTIFVNEGAVAAPVETAHLFSDPPEALAAYLT